MHPFKIIQTIRTNSSFEQNPRSFPVRRVGRRSFIRLRICPARDSTKAILPSLL
uniref:Uncharacterized protein n=1 Tax=Lotus japonicus TaxID=34305 RepID=I3SB46_LOTJA|nr:unknown [Lotus japonicus]